MDSNTQQHVGAGAPHNEPGPPPSPPPPTGPRLRVVLAVLIVGALMLAVGTLASTRIKSGLGQMYAAAFQKKSATESGETSMPGMPGMTGLASESKTGEAAQTPAPKVQYYTCGMHPWVVLPNPGDCPICHMKLVPLDPAKFTGQISINPVMTQDFGIRLAPVVTGPAVYVIRTVGTIDYDETRVSDVTLKISGWITKLYVNYLGDHVEQGQPLFEIYSPELYASQGEYLQAYKIRINEPGSPLASAELLEASRKRLQYYDISDEQITALEHASAPAKTMTIRAPYTGTVVIKNAWEGMKAEAGIQIFRLADLSKVWALVTLYENQFPYLQLGERAVISLPYIPGQTWEGKVTYIYPYLNPESRQIKARLELDNPEGRLKPGMFANVELRGTFADSRTLVPRESVTDTGTRQIAFVSLGEGQFEPRLVRLGVEVEGGKVEVLDGLKPGEMVVVSGEFLLDSEANRREALAKMVKGDLAGEQKAVGAVEAPSALNSLPEPVSTALTSLLDGYLRVAASLAGDSTAAIAPAARQVAEAADALIKTEIPDYPHFWHQHTEVGDLRGRALELVDTKDIAQARERFSDLSAAVSTLLRATGVPPSYGKDVQELHCPMYREGQGGTNLG